MDSKYKRMITLLADKEKARPKRKKLKKQDQWFMYVLTCCDGTLYTGITNDIERRIKKHNSGTGSAYTRLRRPVELAYQEFCGSRNQALIREYQVKKLPRAKKEELVGIRRVKNL